MMKLFMLPAILSSLIFVAPAIALAKENCKVTGQTVTCTYKFKKKKDNLHRWASTYCHNRGFASEIKNARYDTCNNSGTQCKKITAQCTRSQGPTVTQSKKCTLNGNVVTCLYKTKHNKSSLKEAVKQACENGGFSRVMYENSSKYYYCNNDGDRCKKVVAQCKPWSTSQ